MISTFEKLYKFATGKDKLELRKTHVPDETIAPLEPTEYEPARLAIQEHLADRAGKHLDVRLILGNSSKAVSFATRKGLPSEVGQPRLLIRQPDHTSEYAGFSGEIPKGQYGAGTVSLKHDVPVIARSYGNKIDLTVSKGDLKGRYTLVKQNGNHWFAIRHKPPEHFWEERVKYNQADPSMLDHADYVAEHKIDGIHAIARFDAKKGMALADRQKSIMGDIVGSEDKVVHLRDFKVPQKYHGVVIRGELFHPEHPFRTISAVLNSDPHTALEAQKKIGKLSLAAFELVKGPHGKDVKDWTYNQKRAFVQQFVTDVANPLITVPESSYDKQALMKRVLRGGGEGVVLRHILTGEPHKLKRKSDLDLKIVGFEPGSGKYAGKGVGSFRLADKHGNYVGNVGTGLSDTMRQDAFKNPSKYLHKLVKVQIHEVTEDRKLREPRLKGWTLDKREADDVGQFVKMASAPKIEDEVTVQLEKGRGFHIVAMGEIPGTKNPADGDPYDVIIADKKGGQGGRFKVKIVGKITDPTGNHKWVGTTDGDKPNEQQLKSLRGYRAARAEFIGKKMKIEIPGIKDKQVKSASMDDNLGRAGTHIFKRLYAEVAHGTPW